MYSETNIWKIYSHTRYKIILVIFFYFLQPFKSYSSVSMLGFNLPPLSLVACVRHTNSVVDQKVTKYVRGYVSYVFYFLKNTYVFLRIFPFHTWKIRWLQSASIAVSILQSWFRTMKQNTNLCLFHCFNSCLCPGCSIITCVTKA